MVGIVVTMARKRSYKLLIRKIQFGRSIFSFGRNFLNMQVIRTSIKSRTSSNLGKVGSCTSKLLAFEK